MRKKLFFVTLLIASLLLLSPLPSVNANEDRLNIFLEINIEDGDNVNLMFFMGTGSPSGDFEQVTNWTNEWESYPFQANNTTQGNLERYVVNTLNNSPNGFAKKVLGVENIKVNSASAANCSNGIYIKINAKISDTTLHPLSFLGTEYEDRKVDEIVNIKIKIISKNAMLNTPILEFILFHYRLPTGEYMEYSSNTNTINVNSNPFFSPLGSFIILIVFVVMGITICIYARRYMRGVRLGPEVWVLATIFYFCAFIPLSIYLLYVFIMIGLVLSFVKLFKAMKTAKPKVKPKKVSPMISGDAVEKYLGKEKPKEKPVKVDEEAEKAYRELHKYSEGTTISGGRTVKKEKEEKNEKGVKKIDIESLLKTGKEKEAKEGEKKRDNISLLKIGKEKKGETSGKVMEKESGDELMKLMEKKGFKKKGERND